MPTECNKLTGKIILEAKDFTQNIGGVGVLPTLKSVFLKF